MAKICFLQLHTPCAEECAARDQEGNCAVLQGAAALTSIADCFVKYIKHCKIKSADENRVKQMGRT